MDTNVIPGAGAPIAQPAVLPQGVTSSAQPAPMAAAPVVAAPGQPAAGDMPSGNSWTDFFNSINWLEAGLIILGSAGLFYTIHYYNFKLKEDKVANSDMQKQIDEVKTNVVGAMKGKYKAL